MSKTLLILAMFLQPPPRQLPVQYIRWISPEETIVSTNVNVFTTTVLDLAIIDPNEAITFNIGVPDQGWPLQLEVWQTGEPNSVRVEDVGNSGGSRFWSLTFSGNNNEGLHHLQLKVTETSPQSVRRTDKRTIVVYVWRQVAEDASTFRIFTVDDVPL